MISASQSHNQHGIKSYIIQVVRIKVLQHKVVTWPSLQIIVAQDGINYDTAEARG